FIFGKLFGKKIWMRAENPLNQELRKSSKVLLIKKILLKHFLFRFFIDKFLYIGSQNKEFYRYYGVKDEGRFIFTPYAVDNASFREEAKRLHPLKASLKEELKIAPDKKIILYSGKYIEKKRPIDLLKAFNQIENQDYLLIFMGEGELRPEMEQYIRDHKLSNVLLSGFVNQSQISKYYAIADVFVMCSGMGETWGLSVNEAMNFGLPVLVSSTCGSSYDLVREGVNGYVFKEGNIVEMAEKLSNILRSDDNIRKMGEASFEIINRFSIDVIVDNISMHQ
ncbi:MAG TPA: glycosyltransferase family 4 protein, partial [Saprospiraceae bacterium]|nr:glycosyltransferase family 4 protein [Saprospiraceae bacterium]